MSVLLGPLPPSSGVSGVDDWWRSETEARTRFAQCPIDRALAAGFVADRLGWAFASGYQAALTRLDASLDIDSVGALCASEEGGSHPRAIGTTLAAHEEGYLLSGSKRFVTLGTAARTLLVVASTGREESRNHLCVARIRSDTPGVVVSPMSALTFVPEVPHATLSLDAVRVHLHDLLPGDGYTAVLKPFRTLEDLHVTASALGFLIAWSRRAKDHTLVARLIALALSVRTLAFEDPLSPAVHIATAGALASFDALGAEIDTMWTHAPHEMRERWTRDHPLLAIAAAVRAARTDAAWQTLAMV